MTSRHGIKRHYEVESVERMTKWLRSIGWDAHDAERGAITISLVLCSDYRRKQAWEDAGEMTAQRKQQGVGYNASEISFPDGVEYTESGTSGPLLF